MALDTLDAILAGLHTLAGDAGTIADEQLRNRMTGAIVGLRAAVLTARGEVLLLQQRCDRLAVEAHESVPTLNAPSRRPRMKWGCYQFDDTEGLFCAACYDKWNRRVRTMPQNPGKLVCPNCRTLFPMR